jgi:hypothetical protein
VYPCSLANAVCATFPLESYSTTYIAAPGPVPALQAVAKHGAQYDAEILCTYTVIPFAGVGFGQVPGGPLQRTAVSERLVLVVTVLLPFTEPESSQYWK